MNGMPLFEVRNVSVMRGARRIVDEVSLSIRGGELLAVMGENGAGKSTLLKLMAGDLVPAAGEVLLDGRALDGWTPLAQAQRRAVLPQDTAVDFAFTALEIVLLGRSPHCRGNPGAVDRAIAREAMRRTDATHLADRVYPTLSGGERARVMLARAIAQVLRASDGPPAEVRGLLLDEPSAALDIAHQHAAFRTVRDLARDEGVAVVTVLHDPNLAALYADRVALIKNGRLLACGAPHETLTEALASACFSVPMRRVAHPMHDVPLLVAV